MSPYWPKYSAKVEDAVVCGFSWKVLHFTRSWADASSPSWNTESFFESRVVDNLSQDI